jgi:glucose-1-phosphate adenylyltransferase
VLSPGVHLHSWAEVDSSVLMQNVDVGRGAVVRNAIVDKNVRIAPEAKVGVDPDADRERFDVSDNGVVVIGKGAEVAACMPEA